MTTTNPSTPTNLGNNNTKPQQTYNTSTINGSQVHARSLTEQQTDLITYGCIAATKRLQWEYATAYRRRLRLPGGQPNNHAADEAACVELRHQIPIVLAAFLPGVQLIEWDDPNPHIINSLWQLPNGSTIDLHRNYHPTWTTGDPTAITIWHQHQDETGQAVES